MKLSHYLSSRGLLRNVWWQKFAPIKPLRGGWKTENYIQVIEIEGVFFEFWWYKVRTARHYVSVTVYKWDKNVDNFHLRYAHSILFVSITRILACLHYTLQYRFLILVDLKKKRVYRTVLDQVYYSTKR